MLNIAADLKREEVPFLPWAAEEVRLLPDTELLEAVCENNLDPAHMVGK